MGQNNKEKILKIFYEYPIRKFSIILKLINKGRKNEN